MNERIGVVPAPLEVETKARVWRRVRCRSQKGRGKRIETGILEGQPREGFNAASLVNGAPFYYAPPFDDSYFVLIVPPGSIWQPFIPPLSLSLCLAGQTSPSIIDLVENIYYGKTSTRQAFG